MESTATGTGGGRSELNEVINLNVGGRRFTTTRGTLCRDPDSMLAAMFSGAFSPGHRDADGCVFIDRDGEVFSHVINYLRAMKLDLPDNFADHARLLTEAEYFGLRHLQELLCHHQKTPLRRCYLEMWLMESAPNSLEQFYHPHHPQTKTFMRLSGPDCLIRRLELNCSCSATASVTIESLAKTRVMRLELPSNEAKLGYLSELNSLGCSLVSHAASVAADQANGRTVHRSFERYILEYCFVDPAAGSHQAKENIAAPGTCESCTGLGSASRLPLNALIVEKSIPIAMD